MEWLFVLAILVSVPLWGGLMLGNVRKTRVAAERTAAASERTAAAAEWLTHHYAHRGGTP